MSVVEEANRAIISPALVTSRLKTMGMMVILCQQDSDNANNLSKFGQEDSDCAISNTLPHCFVQQDLDCEKQTQHGWMADHGPQSSLFLPK